MGSMWIRPSTRKAIYRRDDYTCYICERVLLNEKRELSLDHLIPRSKGGCNSPKNLATCCKMCNSTRRDAPIPQEAKARARKLTRRVLRRKVGVSDGSIQAAA